MQGEESSWIAPVGKLVELGYKFIWDLESGARLVRDTEAGPEIIRMFVDNGPALHLLVGLCLSSKTVCPQPTVVARKAAVLWTAEQASL